MPLRKLQWFFPIAVTLHNCEEAIWMPQWLSRHAAQLRLQLPGTEEFRFADSSRRRLRDRWPEMTEVTV
jgi:hypothetical protein